MLDQGVLCGREFEDIVGKITFRSPWESAEPCAQHGSHLPNRQSKWKVVRGWAAAYVERRELLLLKDLLERVARRSPHALRLGQAEVVEGSADRDNDVALERVVRRGHAERVGLTEGGIGGDRLGEHGRGVRDVSLGLFRADGHESRCAEVFRASSDKRWDTCPYRGRLNWYFCWPAPHFLQGCVFPPKIHGSRASEKNGAGGCGFPGWVPLAQKEDL